MSNDEELRSTVEARSQRVHGMLGGDLGQALKVALEDPPLLTKDESIKKTNADAVVAVLKAVKNPPFHVNNMESDFADLVMKHVYYGMQSGEGCETLLKWHAALFDKFGNGCVVRAIADRRTPVPSPLISLGEGEE